MQLDQAPHDTHEITQYTTKIYSLRALAQQNFDNEILELSYLLEVRHALQFNIVSAKIDQLLSLAEEASSKNPIRQNHLQLCLLRVILHVFYLMKIGNGGAAVSKLRQHHELMDSQVAKDPAAWTPTGQFDLLICHGRHRLYFDWITQSESYVFGYILSGVVNLPDYIAVKARSFLKEGIRVVDSSSSVFGD
jgi:hypothetical protein